MRELEQRALSELNITSLTLMETAGKRTSDFILNNFPSVKRILIFCGKGNNAGDGFVIARHLWNAFKEVGIVMMADAGELKGDALTNYQALPHRRMRIVSFQELLTEDRIAKTDLIIDAIFGIGLKSDLEGEFSQAVELINGSGKPILAVDIPSGLEADEGSVRGIAVKASFTATMGFSKTGMLKNQGPEHCGEVTIIDIGLPRLDTPRGF